MSSAHSSLLVVIPAYNESESIERVVDELTEICPDVDYVVVNDGSSDDTAGVCRRRGFPLLSLPINLGLAGAVQAGMQYADRLGFDTVLQFDGDGQHDPRYIPQLRAVLADGVDICIGSRFCGSRKPGGMRMLGSRLLTSLIRITTGVRLTDPTSGMRMFSKRLINEFAWNINYGPEPDTIAYLLRNGATMREVPVDMRERQAGTSYLTAFRSMGYMLNMSVSIVFIQWFRKRKVV